MLKRRGRGMGVLHVWYGGHAQRETSYLIGGLGLNMIPVIFILGTGFPIR